MSGFTRHVGKHGEKKVAVIFREIPGEPHMCLVTYTETVNRHMHDVIIQCIDSEVGQHSENLADALNRSYTKDGRPILGVLHVEGQLKKVQTSQVIMTPNPATKIRLDELNTMLNEMKQGEAAVRRMADMDKSRGLQDPADVIRRMRGPQATDTGVDLLGDASLAKQRLDQALRMEREAKGLLAESQRLMDEAASLDPSGIQIKAPDMLVEGTMTKRKYTKKVTNVT